MRRSDGRIEVDRAVDDLHRTRGESAPIRMMAPLAAGLSICVIASEGLFALVRELRDFLSAAMMSSTWVGSLVW